MTRLKRAFDWLLSHSLLSPARGGTDLPSFRGCSERESRNAPDPSPPGVGSTPSTKNAPASRSSRGGRSTTRSCGSDGRHE